MMANANPSSPEVGSFQFSQIPARPNGEPVLHGDGIRLLRSLPLDGLPLKEAVHRHDAATTAVRIAEARAGCSGPSRT